MAEIGKRKLDSGWLAARSTEVAASGIELTTTAPPSGVGDSWMEGVVPGTVLGTLLKNKRIPDPFYGLNNEAIYDIADAGREYYTFWFFTTFQCKPAGNQFVNLNFRAINYSGEVYLNGHKQLLPKGMFRRHSLDITGILNLDGKNLLAVLIYPPDHPGTIPPQGGQGGDHEIGKDVAAQYVEGWDWMTPIRDRNTGIWDEVSIWITGPVKITDPHLVSSFFDDYKRVYLHATMELENKSSWAVDCTVNIEVSSDVEENICLVEHLQAQELSIPPKSTVTYTCTPLFFYKPNLWWPNGMGKQFLYNVAITAEVKGKGQSDAWSHQFGFRKIESTIDAATGGRLFKVNGRPIFIRGGNWILSDGLLRLSKERYMTDIKFHADMNFNMMRCWGGGIAERPEFYYYCDVYGLLVWQEFWITGDVDGRGVPISNPNGPLDHALFLLCARDTIKLLRNHASLALWVGGNEQVPPIDINEALKSDLKLHSYFYDEDEDVNPLSSLTLGSDDPSEYLDGTRVYVQGSLWDGFADGRGDFTDGPYGIQYPEDFFKDDFYAFGFNPEVGSVGVPVAATIRATMPPEAWGIPLFKKQPDGYIQQVPNPTWDYHKYIPYSNPGTVHDQIEMYGHPKTLDDFCEKAQLVNYVQYRALLEGWTSKMWTKYTGVLIWKTQNPWTGLRGQFYDHLLDQTAGFYGCRSAAEPVHVQLNLISYFIEVVNTTSFVLEDLSIEVSVWDLEGNNPYNDSVTKISSPPNKVLPLFEMEYPKSKDAKPVYFLLLKLLHNADKSVISRNFYWLHSQGGDYKLLEQYKSKKVPLKVTSQAQVAGSTYNVRMLVENVSKISNLSCSAFEYKKNAIAPSPRPENKLTGNHPMATTKRTKERVLETKGNDEGVSFFLHFSVHSTKTTKKKSSSSSSGSCSEWEDTRILPVHYSDNYFSVIPGEQVSIEIEFGTPVGATPHIVLQGWNYQEGYSISLD